MSATVPLFEKDRIVVGKPLPFSVFGGDGKLLLAEGEVVPSDHAREQLVLNAAYRGEVDTQSDLAPSGVGDSLTLLRKDYASQSGPRLVVTMAPNESEEAHAASLLGVHEHVMMLTAPVRPDGSLVAVTAGQTWLCRTFQVTSAFRFRAVVLKVASDPFPYLHLEAPKQVECRKVRGRPRASVYIPCRLPSMQDARGVAVDLSVSGARLAVDSSVRLVKDQVVIVNASIPVLDSTFELNLKGIVAAAFGPSDSRHPHVFFYGLKFEGLSELESLVLHGYVSGHLAVELNSLWHVLAAVDGAQSD